MEKLRLGILGSGTGSNYRAIQEEIDGGRLPAEVRIVISDRPSAGILEIARQRGGIKAEFVPPGDYRTRLSDEAEHEIARRLRDERVELVVLAGFMRILKAPLLEAFPQQIINLHPSLLPKFPGMEAWKQALAAGETMTGCSVHYVDTGIDTGRILGQKAVPILPNDTPESLHQRIQEAEHRLYPEVIANLARHRCSPTADA